MAQLADLLSDRFGGAQAFFCNSGAEAIEAAIKYARKATGKPGIVALESSFHGRTLGALSATGQPGEARGVRAARPGRDLRAAERRRLARGRRRPGHRADPDRAGAGRGRRQPGEPGFLAAAAELAAEHGALLCFDEVQTGVGRTGTFFAFEQLGVKPHLVTLAKGLANGLPIGALLVADDAPRARSCPATTPPPSAATRSSAPPPAPSSRPSTTSCSQNVRDRQRPARRGAARPRRRAAARPRDGGARRRGRRRLPRRAACSSPPPASARSASRPR